MQHPNPDKIRLRRRLRDARRALDQQAQVSAATSLPDHVQLLPGWARAEHCALYLPIDGEISTRPLAEQCRQLGHSLYLPVIVDDHQLEFAHWESDAELVSNRHGIKEPAERALRIAPEDLDIIFLPLVGWDRQGHRLGMGGGYYDRALAQLSGPILLVGLAHDCQEVKAVPRDDWDIELDYVATESGLFQCGPGSP
jgi:5-formyltetrahydrofolate cyclo-ligase